jgi:hypothetical protein
LPRIVMVGRGNGTLLPRTLGAGVDRATSSIPGIAIISTDLGARTPISRGTILGMAIIAITAGPSSRIFVTVITTSITMPMVLPSRGDAAATKTAHRMNDLRERPCTW